VRGVAGRSGGSTRWHFLIGGGFPVVTGGFPVVTWGSTSRFFAPPNSWQQHHKYNNRRRFSREPHRPNFAGVECAAHQHRPAPAQATCRGEPACGPFDATNDMIKLRIYLSIYLLLATSLSLSRLPPCPKNRSIPNFRGLGFFSARASDDLPGIRVEPRPQQRCCGSCLFPRAWLPVPLWGGTSSYA
jgi:hypothetical protein